jgi:hypothetical protein
VGLRAIVGVQFLFYRPTKWAIKEDQVYHASNLKERNSAVTDGLKCIGFSNLRGNEKTTTRILDALFLIHESVYST